MPAQKHQHLTQTEHAATLHDAAARLKAARDTLAAAEERLAGFDAAPVENAAHNAQELVRLADEALADALADDDAEAATTARERAKAAIEGWNTARTRAKEAQGTKRALERRRDAAQTELDAAEAAFAEAQAGWLRAELKTAQNAYSEAASAAREAYSRVRAVHARLRMALGDAGRGMTLVDVDIRLPRIGAFAAFDAAVGAAHLDAAAEALRDEITRAGGGA